MEPLTVILRTCDRVQAFSGNRPRDFGSKIEVIRKCTTSLKQSIDFFKKKDYEITVIVVDDHSSDITIGLLKSLFPNVIGLSTTGNGESFSYCVNLAKSLEGLVFLVEDDYLFKLEALVSLYESYNILKTNSGQSYICLHPTDYPDRYTKPYPCWLLLGSDRHYRTIQHTTCTFLYHSDVYREFSDKLLEFSNYGKDPSINEDTTINAVYSKYPCFSPIPSLAEHYQYFDTLSPFYKK